MLTSPTRTWQRSGGRGFYHKQREVYARAPAMLHPLVQRSCYERPHTFSFSTSASLRSALVMNPLAVTSDTFGTLAIRASRFYHHFL